MRRVVGPTAWLSLLLAGCYKRTRSAILSLPCALCWLVCFDAGGWRAGARRGSNGCSLLLTRSNIDVTMAEPGVATAAEAAAASETSPKHVRFASLDLVHNLARRLSATFLVDEAQDEHEVGDADADDGEIFVDSNLSAELDHANGPPQQINRNDEPPAQVGNRNSIIFWRDVVPTTGTSRKKRNKSTTTFPRFAAKRNSPASRLPMTYRKEAATLLVLIAVATEFIGISISLPILVAFASSFGVPQSMTGLVFSVGAFSNFLSNLWIPIRSDNIGRRKIILGTLIGSFIAYVTEASARSFEVLLLGLFLGGLFGGTQPVAVAYISDIYSPAQRPRFIGMVPACASVCFTLGPAMGAYLSKATGSYRAPLIFASIVVAGFIPIMFSFLPESRDIISKAEREEIRRLEAAQPERKTGRMTYDRRTTYASHSMRLQSELSPLVAKASNQEYRGPHRDVRCYMCLFVEFFRTMGMSGFITTLPLVLQDPDFGLKGVEDAVTYTGIIIGIASAFKSLGLFVLFDRIQSKIGLVETMVLGSTLTLGCFLILMFTNSIPLMAFAFSLFCLGSSQVQPSIFTYVTLIVPHAYTARATAMPNFATSLAQTIAPIVASTVLFRTSYRAMYFVFTILMAVELVIAFSFLIQRQQTEGDASQKNKEKDYDDATGATVEDSVPMDEYEELLVYTLMNELRERNYNLRNRKAQKIVLAILHKSFPYLREDSNENDEDMNKLLSELSIQLKRKERHGFEPGSPVSGLRSSTTL